MSSSLGVGSKGMITNTTNMTVSMQMISAFLGLFYLILTITIYNKY